MIRSTVKLSAEDSLFSGSRRGLDVDVPTGRADAAVAALRQLIGYFPDHPAILPIIGAGIAAGRPFVITPPFEGETLDRALTSYGPAELGDALPRLQMLAEALDIAADQGSYHGALHPRSILVSADDTRLYGLGVADRLISVGADVRRTKPYAAPEVLEFGDRSPAADQFAFAAIAHEWLFGRPVAVADDGSIAVPPVPGVREDELARAFAKALAQDPSRRFDSCVGFVTAIKHSRGRAQLSQSLPRLADDELPLHDDLAPTPEEPQPVVEAAAVRSHGRAAVAAVLIGGAALGVLAVWAAMRSNDARPAKPEQGQPFTDAVLSSSARPLPKNETPAPAPEPPALSTPAGGDVARAANVDAGLLIHSVPEGATVTVDGVDRGRTPVAIRGLELGTRTVVVGRPGFRSAERRVLLTADRPSRTLEMQLVPTARAVPAARETRETTEGGLVVDSRPAGAAVLIDGRPAGVTPLSLAGLAPGTYTVRIERAGYRAVTTSVDVKAGERARVAARLEGGQ